MKRKFLTGLIVFILLIIPIVSSAQTMDFEEPRFTVGGFMNFEGMKLVPDKSSEFYPEDFSFYLQNINLYFNFNVINDLSAFIEVKLLFAPSGSAITSSNNYDNTVIDNQGDTYRWSTLYVERAYMEWKKFQSAKIRAGRMLTPYGIWSQDHGAPAVISTRLPMYVVPAYVSSKIPGNVTGLELLGDLNIFRNFFINYAAYVANDDTDQDSNADKEGNKSDKAVGGFLNFKIIPADTITFDIGGSGYNGRVTRATRTPEGLIDIDPLTQQPASWNCYQENTFALAHAKLTVTSLPLDGMFVFQGEFVKQWAKLDRSKNLAYTVFTFFPIADPQDYTVISYYLQGEYHFYNFITPYFRYDYYEADDVTAYYAHKTVTYTTGVNIKPYPQLILKAEYARFDHTNWTASEYNNSIINTINLDQRIYIFSCSMVF